MRINAIIIITDWSIKLNHEGCDFFFRIASSRQVHRQIVFWYARSFCNRNNRDWTRATHGFDYGASMIIACIIIFFCYCHCRCGNNNSNVFVYMYVVVCFFIRDFEDVERRNAHPSANSKLAYFAKLFLWPIGCHATMRMAARVQLYIFYFLSYNTHLETKG